MKGSMKTEVVKEKTEIENVIAIEIGIETDVEMTEQGTGLGVVRENVKDCEIMEVSSFYLVVTVSIFMVHNLIKSCKLYNCIIATSAYITPK